jgi:hypothetical protein
MQPEKHIFFATTSTGINLVCRFRDVPVYRHLLWLMLLAQALLTLSRKGESADYDDSLSTLSRERKSEERRGHTTSSRRLLEAMDPYTP